MSEVIFEDALVRIETRPMDRVLFIRRHPTRAEASELLESYGHALTQLRAYRDWGLVIDVRQVVGRNESGFEQRILQPLHDARRVFPVVVVLVATAAGALQVRRLERDEGNRQLVAQDEAEAIRLCREVLNAAPARG